MDTGLIVAIVGSTIAIVGVVISMMFWMRTEANTLITFAKKGKSFVLLAS